jgi:hypothetical protein
MKVKMLFAGILSSWSKFVLQMYNDWNAQSVRLIRRSPEALKLVRHFPSYYINMNSNVINFNVILTLM